MIHASLPPGMRHVERRELYENLQVRLNYLQSFLDFAPADVNALRKGQAFIKSNIPALAEIPFQKLLQHDITAQALLCRSTTEEPDFDADDYYGPNSKNMKNRAMFVRWYLTKINSDPTTTQYWEYMNMVGAMHNSHGRRSPLQIDVIHFSLLLGHLQNVVTDIIITSTAVPTQDKAPLVKAWSKLFWIQNDLFSKWHVKDGDQYDQLKTEAMKLDLATDMSGMKDDAGKTVQCPFSGMAKQEKVEKKGLGYVYMSQGKESTIVLRPKSVVSSISSSSPLSPVNSRGMIGSVDQIGTGCID